MMLGQIINTLEMDNRGICADVQILSDEEIKIGFDIRIVNLDGKILSSKIIGYTSMRLSNDLYLIFKYTDSLLKTKIDDGAKIVIYDGSIT